MLEYYNVIVLEIRFFPFLRVCWMFWLLKDTVGHLFIEFPKLFLQRVYSFSCVAIVVSVPQLVFSEGFDRDFLEYQELTNQQPTKQTDETHLSHTADFFCVRTFLQYLARLELNLQISPMWNLGSSQVFSEDASCPENACCFQNSPAYMADLNFLISLRKFPQLLLSALDGSLYVSAVIFCPRHLQVFSGFFVVFLINTCCFFHPEFQVRWNRDRNCYGLNCVCPLPQIICWSANPQYLRT